MDLKYKPKIRHINYDILKDKRVVKIEFKLVFSWFYVIKGSQ